MCAREAVHSVELTVLSKRAGSVKPILALTNMCHWHVPLLIIGVPTGEYLIVGATIHQFCKMGWQVHFTFMRIFLGGEKQNLQIKFVENVRVLVKGDWGENTNI